MKSIETNFIKPSVFLFLFFIFFKTIPAFGQVVGCTDPDANNYDPSAAVNDGSCTYNITTYTPPVRVDPISDTLTESSGLQWAGNSLWSFNDRGGTPDLYRIDTASKAILQIVRLEGATNVDWEELTFDSTYFYVGDFGNNLNGARTDLKIYKFPFSAIPDYTTNREATIPAEQIEILHFTYSNQPQPPDTVGLNATQFDCEAMIVENGKIHLFTKDWVDLTSTHYVINGTVAGNYVAAPVDTLQTGYLVTGATQTPKKEITALLGYDNSLFKNHYLHILSGYSNGKFFNGNKRKINLPNATYMGQAEGITFRNDTYGYISNEKVSSFTNQKLFSFDIGHFVPSNILAEELNDFSVSKLNGIHKITWNFSSIVHGLEIQQSPDALRFTIIKTYHTSMAGSFDNKPANNLNYYRLAWKQNNGGYQYSKVIRIKNEENKLISNLVLRANGDLSFTLSGGQSEYSTFKLFSTDGKMLSQSGGHSYLPGFNKINFSNNAVLNDIVLVIINSNSQKTTTLLHVLK
jgi:hypothetical protein